MKMQRICLVWLLSLFLVTACSNKNEDSEIDRFSRPNILVIMADDLGYSDIGAFGGEIDTPNLDSIANQGLTLTNFHTHIMCTPTRAMMLTGINNHAVGIGTMSGEQRGEQKNAPGYEAYLRHDVILLSELLQQNGYETYISGKWDLGGRNDATLLPNERGFDRSFVLVEGSADHFRNYPALAELSEVNYKLNGEKFELPKNFYSTEAYAEKMIEFISTGDKQQPFFGFLSFTAPHYPLQARASDIDKYEGVYEVGYQKIMADRLIKMKQLGIVNDDFTAASFHHEFKSWEQLSELQKQFESRRMQVYAGMVDAMDQAIGKVLSKLKETGQSENTVIVFLSDNGPEGGNPLDWAEYYNDWAISSFDLSLENLGHPNSFAWTGPGWAAVSSTPFSMFKGFTFEGGTRVPALIQWPKRLGSSANKVHSFTHILDLPATFLSLAGVSHPGTEQQGFINRRLEGKSLEPILDNPTFETYSRDDAVIWEMLDRRAVRKGPWKLVWANKPWGKGIGQWALYDIVQDPSEQIDVSMSFPAIVEELEKDWLEYINNNKLVLLKDGVDIGWTNTISHYDYTPIPTKYLNKASEKEKVSNEK